MAIRVIAVLAINSTIKRRYKNRVQSALPSSRHSVLDVSVEVKIVVLARGRAIGPARIVGGNKKSPENWSEKMPRPARLAEVKPEVSRCRSAIANRATTRQEEEEVGVLETW